MVGSIGQILPAQPLRQAPGHGPIAPAGLPARPADSVTIANLGAANFAQVPGSGAEQALNQAAAGDSALGEVAGILCDVKHLVSQSGTDYSGDDAASRQIKVDANLASVDRVAGTATFNGQLLLDGNTTIAAKGRQVTLPSAKTTSLGATTSAGAKVTLADLRTGGQLAIANANAPAASQVVNTAIAQVRDARQDLAAFAQHVRPPQPASDQGGAMLETMKSIRAMMLGAGTGAAGEGNRAAIVQILK